MKKDRLSHRFLVEQSRFTLLNNLKPTVEVAICKILKKSNLLVHLSLHNETMIVSLGDIYISMFQSVVYGKFPWDLQSDNFGKCWVKVE